MRQTREALLACLRTWRPAVRILSWVALFVLLSSVEPRMIALGGGQGSPPLNLSRDAFLADAERLIARGRGEQARALAESRGARDAAAAAVLGRLAVGSGQYAEAERILASGASVEPEGEAALELGLLQLRLGRKAAGERTLERILAGAGRFRSERDLARAGRAARALGLFRDANAYFREAVAARPGDAAVNAAWGELFLEKYNRADAAQSFRAALEADAEWTPALLGLARTLAEENPPEARKALERALAINKGDPDLHLFAAELALDDGHRAEAHAAIARALEINPASLEARSLLAAVAYLEDRPADFSAEVGRVLAINPSYGEVYRVAGDLAARNYRFDEAVALVSRAVELDPDRTRAFADLGMHLLRTGDEPRARDALERAFKRDAYDVVTYNLLGLLDTLDTFQTVKAGDLVVRFHPEEVNVLREYVIPLAEQALRNLSQRYGFKPRGPILIEVFPRHDDFAVRNLGLPGMIGALGACFGRVVTLDSPRAQRPGTFNWQATLWHELAHVVTLQLSKQRVPRWLTEGISVYEEAQARPEWGRDGEIAFAEAMERKAILPLADLNAGFTSGETIGLAYYEASLLVEHIVESFGDAALPRLVAAYGEGLDDEGASKRALGVSLSDLQASFDASLDQRFAALRRALRPPQATPAAGDQVAALRRTAEASPGSYPAQYVYGQAAYEAGEWEEARRALERAAQLIPMVTGRESPRALLAEIAVKQGDRRRAMAELEQLLQHDHTSVEAARRLVVLADEADDDARLRVGYERVVMLDPFDAGAHGALGRLALRNNEVELALRELRAALAAGPVDLVAVRCDLAESYLLAGRPEEAKREALAALEIAPSYERAQELLLKTVEVRP